MFSPNWVPREIDNLAKSRMLAISSSSCEILRSSLRIRLLCSCPPSEASTLLVVLLSSTILPLSLELAL